MNIIKEYVVYKLSNLLGSDELCLKIVEFKGYQNNSFDTEEEAIEALIEDKRTYNEYIILKQVYIRS